MAHAGVSPLPRVAVDAITAFTDQGSSDHQESGFIGQRIKEARAEAAALLGCREGEIALLGPTSLGLNLVANGLDWEEGDEVVHYPDDYPANVYPWTKLRCRGVRPVALRPERPGRITWDTVAEALTEKTRLVALATCHFLSGYRIDVDTIGRNLRGRDILFCLDGIQSLGAFPLSVEHVDFLSADSHKWLLGPLGAGIFYVRESLLNVLEPTLLGAWNVRSPDFIAQEEILFVEGARRYEPGALNVPGILGMLGSLKLLRSLGIGAVAGRILKLRRLVLEKVRPLGYRPYGDDADPDPAWSGDEPSGILTLSHQGRDMEEVFHVLAAKKISVSLRRDRSGRALLRVSPHFYNSEEEVESLVTGLRV